MKKLKGKMTIICNTYQNRNIEIEIEDELSSHTFIKLVIKPEDFTAMLGRLASVEVDMGVCNLDRVGKKMLTDTLEFEMPEVSYKEEKEVAMKLAKENCPAGWIDSGYFNSQDSFFYRDKKRYARCTIRKWE